MYRIDGNLVEMIPANIYESMSIFKNIDGVIAFPKTYDILSYDDSDYPVEANAGVMFWNTDTGERAKWVNPVYESIKRMKRIEPFPQYLYFCLRRIRYKQIEQCNEIRPMYCLIENYPAWKRQMHRIDEEFRLFVQSVYDVYLEMFVYKYKQTNLLKKHGMYAAKIHTSVYLPRMRMAKKQKTNSFFVNKRVVRDFFDQMEPRELMYIMNEDRRM
jgi:hypothetical protein